MAGGYFDLPLSSSRRSSPTNVPGGDSRSPGPRVSPQGPSNESFPERQFLDPSGAQGRQRNAGILKSANRVKFTVNDGPMNLTPTSQPSGDGRGPPLPQKPLPTASIPVPDRDALGPHSVPFGVSISSFPAGATSHSRDSSAGSAGSAATDEVNYEKGKALHSAYTAQERAHKLASHLGRPTRSPSQSPWPSLPSSAASTPPLEASQPLDDADDIPMIKLPDKQFDYYSDEDDDHYGLVDGRPHHRSSEAHQLVQQMTRRDFHLFNRIRAPSPGFRSGQVTPLEERDPENYVQRPSHYRGGILSSLLKLYNDQPGLSSHRGRYGHSRQNSSSDLSRGLSPDPHWHSPQKRKWYEKSPNQSNTSLAGSTAKNSTSSPFTMLKRSRSSGAVPGTMGKRMGKPDLEDEIRITVQIAELLSRQRYLLILCKALMKFGAPTHRLEEYMKMTARVLEISANFLYLPGCMIVSFDDASTHTTEVKLIRVAQGVDLGKLSDAHTVYKEVIHDVIGVEEAMQRLTKLMQKNNKYPIWLLIILHGLASASVGPFAFGARPIDMPIAFLLGCLLGILQLVLSPRSHLYSNVFEISAAVLTSFLARAFGSIPYKGGHLFCFAALAQSSIALILPGYIVLCASLELQSRSMVAGSVRMVYAIIYSLFLGFGITIGTAVYGLLDSNASTDYTCPASPITNEYLQRFPFVIIFTFCLATVNQAKLKQIPVMLVIAFTGYITNYFGAKRFYSSTQVSSALGAFVVGVMANLYSRLRHGLAAAAMLPAIFVLVPSGLAASGSLISGIASAGQITTQQTPFSVPSNGTQGFVDAANNMTTMHRQQSYQENPFQGVVFDIGYGMVQVAVGFTVGLFLAALVVYPLGKKRSGLFSF